MYGDPLVTIGIINYNGLKFIGKCVESYLGQTYENIEMLIVDDGSSDGSAELLKEMEQTHDRIRCIRHEKNSGGPSLGIREVIREARGKYFQWIASDDFAEKDAVRKWTEYLERTGLDYAYCHFNVVDKNNAVTSHWKYSLPALEELVRRVFAHCSGVIPMNGLYRTEFFRRKGITWNVYRNNDYSCDTINSMYFALNGMKYGMIDESLINYRIHEHNCSHDIEKRIRTSFTIYDFIIKNFEEAVYLPEIRWEASPCREQLKNYVIASFLYNKAAGYLQGNGIPHHLRGSIDRATVGNCLGDFMEEGLRYTREGLAQGELLKKELTDLEKRYRDLIISERIGQNAGAGL